MSCINLRLTDSNMNRKPKDISSSNILHDLERTGKKCTHSIYENGTDNLNNIVSHEYSKKEWLPFSPSVIGYCIQSQYIPRPRGKGIHARIHKKIHKHISRHTQIFFHNVAIIILQRKIL